MARATVARTLTGRPYSHIRSIGMTESHPAWYLARQRRGPRAHTRHQTAIEAAKTVAPAAPIIAGTTNNSTKARAAAFAMTMDLVLTCRSHVDTPAHRHAHEILKRGRSAPWSPTDVAAVLD
jgi:hypothetical protein